ncbi:MAG TPA: hypothetical protein DDY13_16500 [Cytophagales bacterium]|jgi:hypothetical protein|nr:hypothetical protein [Cytophagales bacterium]
MKIRFDKNKLVVRISDEEIQQLRDFGQLTECFAFPPNNHQLMFQLLIARDDTPFSVTYEGTQVKIWLEAETAKKWLSSNEISLQTMQQNISIIVEKDLAPRKKAKN